MPPAPLVDKNGLKNDSQLSKPIPPSKVLDISNWEPAPPKWEKVEPSVEQMKCECEKFKRNITAECSSDIFKHKYVMNNFKTFVYDSNAFEDAGEDESKTRALINGVFEQQNEDNLNVSQLEVVNHVKAVKKVLDLSIKELVTIDGLKSVHKVLMEGVLESAGELRTCQASTSMYHQYPHPRDVPKLLQLVIEQYQAIEESTTYYDIFTKAAWLKCQLLIIHPFEDGNGRLSRIFLAVMFIKSGLYIFPPLSKNGHRKSTKHYIKSLLKATKGQSESELAFFFLKCCYNIAHFFNNCQESCAVL